LHSQWNLAILWFCSMNSVCITEEILGIKSYMNECVLSSIFTWYVHICHVATYPQVNISCRHPACVGIEKMLGNFLYVNLCKDRSSVSMCTMEQLTWVHCTVLVVPICTYYGMLTLPNSLYLDYRLYSECTLYS